MSGEPQQCAVRQQNAETAKWGASEHLIIDPSGQATEFLLNEYKDRKVQCTYIMMAIWLSAGWCGRSEHFVGLCRVPNLCLSHADTVFHTEEG